MRFSLGGNTFLKGMGTLAQKTKNRSENVQLPLKTTPTATITGD